MYCIHMYCVLQSLVTRHSHFQSQMCHILHTWNHPEDLYVEEESVMKWLVTRRKNTSRNEKLETEGEWDCVPTVELITL